jgi:hypothetical protein
VPVDPQRPGQARQGWFLLIGIVGTFVVIVVLAIWAAHRG